MLVFERTKEGEISCAMSGTLADITQDLILCIGAVHNGVKLQQPEAAAPLRAAVEAFCAHGSRLNEAIFEHFDKPELINEALKQENAEMKAKMKSQAAEAIKALKELFMDAFGKDDDSVDEIRELLGIDEDEDDA